jgi:hypothetical protein
MQVDIRTLICGVKPALLKRLLERDEFDTPMAMKDLDLREPAATQTLVALEAEGWIKHGGTYEGIDHWSIDQKGSRLVATRLLKRTSIEEARRILDALIGRVRQINADSTFSYRVRHIVLFGSALTASPGASVGDIDLVVQLGRRVLDPGALDALCSRERAEKPAHIDKLYWPETRIRRDLARVSRYLSFHAECDVTESRAPHQEIYRYDVERECEMAPDRNIRVLEPTQPDESTPAPERRPVRLPRPWPRPPSKGTPIEIDDEKGRIAQHLWINHVPIKKIATRLRVATNLVQGYLATLADPRPPTPPINASLKQMLLAVLPRVRNFVVCVDVQAGLRRDTLIDVCLLAPRVAKPSCLRRVGSSYRIIRATTVHVATLETCDLVTAAWFEALRPRLGGLGLTLQCTCLATDQLSNTPPISGIDVRELRAPMMQALDALWKKPRGRFDAWETNLSLLLGSQPVLTFERGRNPPKEKVVRDSYAAPVLSQVQLICERSPAVFAEATWRLNASGAMLEESKPESQS